MSILFAEDFKGYGTNKNLLENGLWGTAAFSEFAPDPDPTAQPDPVTGCNLVAEMIGGFCQARRPFPNGALAVAGVAFRMWLNSLPNFTCYNMRFLDGGNGPQCSFAITPTGVAQIYRGNGSGIGHGATLLGETATPVTTANAWHHYEFKVVTTPDGVTATGSAELRIDGVSVLTVDNVATGPALQIGLGNTNDYSNTAGWGGYYKDLVCWDGTGAHNNDFLGTVSVISLWPDSDVSLGWTPATGTEGYPMIVQSPPIDNTDYIVAPFPAPPPSTFTLSDLPQNVSSVRGLITQVRARKSDGGDGNIQASLISSGTDIDGSDRPLTTAFTYYEDVFETDPHTAAPWTVAAADSAEFKINRTL